MNLNRIINTFNLNIIRKTNLMVLALFSLNPIKAEIQYQNQFPPHANFESHFSDTFSEIHKLHRDIDKLFYDSFGEGFKNNFQQQNFSPKISIDETSDQYIVTADLPGIDQDNLDIRVEKNKITLSGERKSKINNSKSANNKNTKYQEISYGKFTRSIQLDNAVNIDNVDANYKDGVLFINLHKLTKDNITSKKVPIKIK